ncbi:MAG: molybdopterin-containing oxidoreductase family protein [bacterium]
MKVYVDKSCIQKVAVDTKAPIIPGSFCIRPTLAKEYQEHPFRLNYPLKRQGKRGNNKWKQISWDQAFDEIAEKLGNIRTKYGAEAVSTSSGTGRGAGEFAKTRFMNLFGSPNRFGIVTICYGPRSIVWYTTFGGAIVPDRKLGTTRMMVLWGRNPHEGGPSTWHSFKKAKKDGMRTLVIDPRCTEAARQADCWVQIKPGTDAALALGMMHILIHEGLYDKQFVNHFTSGFSKLRDRVKDYPPDRTAKITGLSELKIIETTRFFSMNQPSTMVIGVAAEHGAPNSIQAIRAINILRVITGSIDVEGGGLISAPCKDFIPDAAMELNHMLTSNQRNKQIGSERFRLLSYPGWELIEEQLRKKYGDHHPLAAYLNCMAHAPSVFRAMLTQKPYPVKALIVSASNPLLSYANTRLVYNALMSTELLVTFDITRTPTTQISDYVLPAACWMERADMGNFASVGAYPLVQMGEAAVPSSIPDKYERLNDYEFWRGLGIRLGQRDYWPWKTFEEVWEYRIKKIMERRNTKTLSEFINQQRWEIGPLPQPGVCLRGPLATPSGKIEIYSTIFEKLGYDPLPAYQKPHLPDEYAKKYRLINITGARIMPYHHSEFRHVDGFRKQHPDPIVEIHRDCARRKGIVDGDWVWIETPIGKVKQRARLTTSFDPGYICTEHSWWFPEMSAEWPFLYGLWESNINATTDDDPAKCDPLSGAWPLKGQYMRCRIYKAD